MKDLHDVKIQSYATVVNQSKSNIFNKQVADYQIPQILTLLKEIVMDNQDHITKSQQLKDINTETPKAS